MRVGSAAAYSTVSEIFPALLLRNTVSTKLILPSVLSTEGVSCGREGALEKRLLRSANTEYTVPQSIVHMFMNISFWVIFSLICGPESIRL
jgi:hypothetical protein